MRIVMMLAALLAGLLALTACASLPAAPAPTSPATAAVAATNELPPTEAPAATVAPGSTEAAPTVDAFASPGAEMPPAQDEPRPTATVDPALNSPPTTAPLPTMPPAPTAEPVAIECVPGALTPAQTEGPYYTANPPETNSLLQPGMAGTRLLLTGYVLDEECRQIPGARVDFWQADAQGQYDNEGYTLRGYTLTDAEGRYSMETVVPGEYPGRTPHIHVKVTAPGGATLTSQLYLPGAVANATDRIFSPDLVVDLQEAAEGFIGSFDFVVRMR